MTIYSFSDPVFWLYLIYFLIAFVVAVIIPSRVILNRFKIHGILAAGTVIPLGLSLWGWQGFIFGYLRIRQLSYLYILLFFIIFIRDIIRKKYRFRNPMPALAGNPLLVLLAVTGVLSQMTAKWFTMMRWGGATVMCCSDIGDDIWYASIAKELVAHFPPVWPGLGDIPLQNYHYWSNLVVADISRVFNIPVNLVQFQFMPLMLSVSVGLALIGFGKLLKLKNSFIAWLLIFVYLGGDAIYFVTLLLGKGWNQTMSSLEDGARFLGNLPRAYAVSVFLGLMILIVHWWKDRNKYMMLVLSLVASSLTGFKIYFGIFIIMGLGFVALYDLRKKTLSSAVLVVSVLFLSLVIFLPTNTSSGGFFYTGFWAFENFAVQPALGLTRMEMARLIFARDGKWYRVLPYDLFFLGLYFVSIFGTKLLAFIQTKKTLRMFPVRLNILLIPGLFICLIWGGFFQQTVGGSNTFNFLALFFIVVSYYTALAVWSLSRKLSGWKKILFIILVLLLTLPRGVHEVGSNLNRIANHTTAKLPAETEKYTDYIRNNTGKKSVILVNYREFGDDLQTTVVHFLTGRQMYFSGKNRLEIFNADTFDRQKTTDSIFQDENPVLVADLMKNSEINYILATSAASFASTDSAKFMDTVYHDRAVALFKIDRQKISAYLDKVRVK